MTTTERKWSDVTRVYVLGNPLLREDALPLKLLPRFRELFPQLYFSEWDPTEGLPGDDPLILVDTIVDLAHVRVLTDISKIQPSPAYSLHDFDLGFTLKLWKKMGKLGEVVIIGFPPSGDEKELLAQFQTIMTNSLSGNATHS